jgi:hypothetical protein
MGQFTIVCRRTVEGAITEPVEPMAAYLAGGRFQRADAGQSGKRRFGAAQAGVRPGHE